MAQESDFAWLPLFAAILVFLRGLLLRARRNVDRINSERGAKADD